jgi:hypothetical protein
MSSVATQQDSPLHRSSSEMPDTRAYRVRLRDQRSSMEQSKSHGFSLVPGRTAVSWHTDCSSGVHAASAKSTKPVVLSPSCWSR